MRIGKTDVRIVAFGAVIGSVVLSVVFIVCAFAAPGAAAADAAPDAAGYPAKLLRMVVGFTAGGAADVQARVVAQALAESFGQQVLVDNRPGQDAIIGTNTVAKASPDGYTIGYVTAGFTTSSILHAKTLPYDPVRDFAPVSVTASGPLLLVVNPALPIRSLKDLVALAKRRPGELNFASAGAGGTMHLAGELLKTVANIRMVHVPYKGGGQAVTDIISGQVEVAFVGAPAAMPHIQSGRLRLLAVSTKKRSAALPDVPSVAELGYPDYEFDAWYGVLAPKGAPPAIVGRLSREIAKVVRTQKIREAFLRLGIEPVGSTPEEFRTLVEKEIARWTPIMRKAGLKAE
jgi:tripartite-type tricarboxylate transporter receptor subunit TctC